MSEEKRGTPDKTRMQRVIGLVRRAIEYPGPDRDALLLIVKGIVASTVAWVLANNVLAAPSATFAPLTALLMVHVTISQSLDHAVRYAAAMVGGVVLAGLLTPVLGATTVTFAVLMLIALVLGRWRKLGQQGPQVGVAALFAYSSFTQAGTVSSSVLQLVNLVGLVLLGCVLGVVTNLVIVPPLRYRSAEYGIDALSRSLSVLLTDISAGLQEGAPSQDQADAWLHRVDQFPAVATQARSTVEHVAETMRFNPRRWFRRRTGSFEGHRTIINALERAGDQLRAATRGLSYTTGSDDPQQNEHDQFCRTYGQMLAVISEAARVLGELRNAEDTEHTRELDETIDRARKAYNAVVAQAEGQHLDDPDQWPVYGALQTDAHRLVGEFIQAQKDLSRLANPGANARHIPDRGDPNQHHHRASAQ